MVKRSNTEARVGFSFGNSSIDSSLASSFLSFLLTCPCIKVCLSNNDEDKRTGEKEEEEEKEKEAESKGNKWVKVTRKKFGRGRNPGIRELRNTAENT